VSSLQVRLILMSIHGKIVGASKIARDITDRQRAKVMLRSNGRYQLILTWTEKGSPAIQKPLHKGFGTRMMEQMIETNTGATYASTAGRGRSGLRNHPATLR
jgi:two-component sensor histidine kinase